ncbi:exopolysaccharide biosynthesis polyprenyl glycosylphosphotransferase [Streptomyces tsukubensis]|uniref:Bacterial sugar transferase domain-containing protein n=1 Tax=Streptomyces tsukubensis TaxID=83656 RepID=A0A1V4A477_9ACTN|nr:exopolysaccharide biosynthesis polyprenyl glycosylphosphotransferase [Streptomyces tsukubensis]OON75372.1 hypothetical protein B1H18_23095 [Streptomyces tsukubensis]QFR94998.1 exopolysaccharide biosynthesis polyprenyl glycosylphosphotransferase [Streptomyces tsukubensis]
MTAESTVPFPAGQGQPRHPERPREHHGAPAASNGQATSAQTSAGAAERTATGAPRQQTSTAAPGHPGRSAHAATGTLEDDDRASSTAGTGGAASSASLAGAGLGAPREGPDGFAVPSGPTRWRMPAGAALLAVDWAAALAAATLVLPQALYRPLLTAVLLVCVTVLGSRASLYRPTRLSTALDELPVLYGRVVGAWCAVAALVAAVSPARAMALPTLAAAIAVHGALSWTGRGAVYGRRRWARFRRPDSALLLGAGPTPHAVGAALSRGNGCGLRPVGVIGDRSPGGPQPHLPVLSGGEEIQRAVVQNGVRAALLVGQGEGGAQAAQLRLLRAYGCEVWQLDVRPPGQAERGPTEGQIAGYPCRRLDAGPRRGGLGKRLQDVALAAPALLVLSPLLLVCALAVRLCDGPGVLFRQERVGLHGRHFTLLKFRTLRPDTSHESATRWNVAGDRRMSRVGRFLRRSSLDELPQLWNVVRGDMSLVGPRPERPYFVAEFSRTYAGYPARHRAKAGITGLAQISGLRGDTSIEDRCRFDNYYIDHWSLWQDTRILLRTAASLVRPSGS